ncbi:myelin-associated glycoprotein-like [Rhincodon typus]|uniref:myelin-associated glycoprotein-like n=1 Tax=Rhincodon typus TaxID=259920 RepID=UPI00202E1416|nr:myelin-associated glycoprotein-like [Rhincodon typus]
MQLLLKLLFILQTAVQGVPSIGEVTQPRLITALRGELVSINCTFIIYNGIDADWVHANWKRDPPSGNITAYEMKKLTCVPNVPLGGLKLCAIPLKIENASFHHSAYKYICVVKVPNIYPPLERKGQGTQIQIYELSEISIMNGSLVAGQKSVLTCSVQGLYSENISFIWTCNGTNMMTNITVSTLEGIVNGKTVVTSQFQIIPRVTDHGTVCMCQINHVIFKQPVTKKIKLDVMYGPRDPTITYKLKNNDSYHLGTNSITVPKSSFVELRCSVDSNPVATVTWLKNWTNHTSTGSSSSTLTMTHFQSQDAGVYWCVANNSYGWTNGSVSLVAFQGDHWLLYIVSSLVGVIGFISVVAIYFCLIWKRQLKDPVNVSIEPSPKTMIRNENCNTESDIIYAFVKRNNLPSNPKHATADHVNEYSDIEQEEEVSYADIVIHHPRQQCCDQQPEQISDVTGKNNRGDFKYLHGSSPHKYVDDNSEYSVVRVSHQGLRTV